jgi:hypothetical protein
MKIAIDVDDTMFDNDVLNQVLFENGIDPYIKNYSWDLHELPENVINELYSRWNNPDYMCCLTPFLGVYKKLIELYEAGHELYALSARNSELRIRTIEMIEFHFVNFYSCKNLITDLFCIDDSTRDNNKVYGKNAILKSENFDVFIDDSPKYIEAAISEFPNMKIFLVSNIYTRHNYLLRHNYGKHQ